VARPSISAADRQPDVRRHAIGEIVKRLGGRQANDRAGRQFARFGGRVVGVDCRIG
jgi:hypothetical protein